VIAFDFAYNKHKDPDFEHFATVSFCGMWERDDGLVQRRILRNELFWRQNHDPPSGCLAIPIELFMPLEVQAEISSTLNIVLDDIKVRIEYSELSAIADKALRFFLLQQQERQKPARSKRKVVRLDVDNTVMESPKRQRIMSTPTTRRTRSQTRLENEN
jgi:hypothetical protein